jgi:arylsulfatase A-like enzyme
MKKPPDAEMGGQPPATPDKRFPMSKIPAIFSALSLAASPCAFAAETAEPSPAAPKNRPVNILQIITHDSGRHFGCYGHPTLSTPNIDKLASEGVKFEKCFAVTPICCASRASLYTGRYPQSHGVLDLWWEPGNWRLHDDELHMAQILKGAGYRTILMGMQHEVDDKDSKRLGYDEIVEPLMQPIQILAPKVVDFLNSAGAKERPFFLQVGLLETHVPWKDQPDTEKGVEVPPYLVDDEDSRAELALYQANVRRADLHLGTIFEALRRNGLEHDTLVIFTVDHGIELPRAKWNLYDPGVEVALIMRCPALGLTGGKTVPQMVSNVDVLPSILELAGVPVPSRVQGVSFVPALRGDPKPVREAVYGQYLKNNTRSVRTERYKLIRHFDDNANDSASLPVKMATAYKRKSVKNGIELYDLQSDPLEFVNLANKPEHAAVVRQLDDLLWKWLESVDDPILKGPMVSNAYLKAVGDYQSWKKKKRAKRKPE